MMDVIVLYFLEGLLCSDNYEQASSSQLTVSVCVCVCVCVYIYTVYIYIYIYIYNFFNVIYSYIGKAFFSSHNSSLQCHMIFQKSF